MGKSFDFGIIPTSCIRLSVGSKLMQYISVITFCVRNTVRYFGGDQTRAKKRVN